MCTNTYNCLEVVIDKGTNAIPQIQTYANIRLQVLTDMVNIYF